MSRVSQAVLQTLRALRDYERRALPFVQTLEDYALLVEIGYRQASRRPVTLKELMLLGLTSVPTLQRRLRRLRQLGVVEQRRCEHDRREIELLLAARVMKAIDGCDGPLGAYPRSPA